MAGKNKTYELMLKIGGKVDGSLKTACSTADKNLAALGKTAKTAGKIAAGAMVAAATAVATLGTAAVKSAAEYEAQLANVSTLLTGTEAEVAARTAEIGDQVLEISNRTGVATADLTDGMYQVVSAFGDSADAAAILETAAKSAAAGNATTTDSINLLSAVTKGYGDTPREAVQQAADLAFATVRLGQTSFPETGRRHGQGHSPGQYPGAGARTAMGRHGHADRRYRFHGGSSYADESHNAGVPLPVQEYAGRP